MIWGESPNLFKACYSAIVKFNVHIIIIKYIPVTFSAYVAVGIKAVGVIVFLYRTL